MAVVVEGVALGDLAAVDAADGEVHARQAPGGVIRLLAVDRDVGLGLAAVAVPLRVRLDELHGLHEHARRAAAGIVHPAEHVLGAAGFVADLDVADHVDQLAEALFVERRASAICQSCAS